MRHFLSNLIFEIFFSGIFEWGFLYKETQISGQELLQRKHGSEPFRSFMDFFHEKKIFNT